MTSDEPGTPDDEVGTAHARYRLPLIAIVLTAPEKVTCKTLPLPAMLRGSRVVGQLT